MGKVIGRRALLKAATACIVGGNMWSPRHANAAASQLTAEGPFPPLHGATEWINSPPLIVADMRGKVVLVDFWTYTCINWLRTLPYLRAWSAKYKDSGLVVVLGVHSPEFSFESDPENVRWAVKSMAIDYPVAVDSNHAIWRAFDNQYWPALYLVDRQGRIRYHHFGEGEYVQSERIVQQLLSANWCAGRRTRRRHGECRRPRSCGRSSKTLQSPENYLGYARAANFVGDRRLDEVRQYAVPANLVLNEWVLSGDWTLKAETIAPGSVNARIVYRFHARDVNLVMGPTARGTPVRFRVSVDDRPPSTAHGADVDENGNGTVREQRVYQLIRQTQPITDRLFEIEFLNAGVEVYAFTFG